MSKEDATEKLTARVGLEGHIELVDPKTGAIIPDPARAEQRAKPSKQCRVNKKRTVETVTNYAGKLVQVPKGFNPDDLPRIVWPYSLVTCEHICREISTGKTLVTICKQKGFPDLNAVFRWRREHPEFEAQVREAKRMRAEWAEEQAIQAAENAEESTAKSSRLKFDAYTWTAEINDRAQYGKQTKVTGDPSQPIAFTVVTGVPDPDPEKPPEKEVESQ